MTRSFMLFLALFVALGISIGGSFAGGVAFGRSQDNEASPSTATFSSTGNFGQQSSGQASQGFSAGEGLPENLAQLRQRIQSGDVNPEDLAQLRERFQSGDVNPEDLAQIRERFGSGDASTEELAQPRQQFGGRFGGGPGQGFGGGITGTVETVDGNQVTVETADGPRIVTIGLETVIQKSTTGTLEDLQQGVRIAAFGSPGDEEGVEARFVVLLPEGGGGPFGDGLFFGGSQGHDGGASEGTGGFGERRFRRNGGSP